MHFALSNRAWIGHELYLYHTCTNRLAHMHVRQGDKSPLTVCKTCLQYSTDRFPPSRLPTQSTWLLICLPRFVCLVCPVSNVPMRQSVQENECSIASSMGYNTNLLRRCHLSPSHNSAAKEPNLLIQDVIACRPAQLSSPRSYRVSDYHHFGHTCYMSSSLLTQPVAPL